jgi:hypothetical protein
MTMADEKPKKLGEELEENAIMAAGIVRRYLKGEINGGDFVKTASLSIGHFNKYLATKGANDTNKLVALRGISANSDEFKEYVRLSMPDMIPVKKIEHKPK